MKALFIGGPKDGVRMEIESPPRHMEFPYILNDYGGPKFTDEVSSAVYQLMKYDCREDRFCIYAVYGMSYTDVMDALIDRYPVPLIKK